MLKKDVLGKASAKSLDDAFRCGECLHFKKHAHSAKQEPCHKSGIKSFALAPKCFTPDVTQIATNSDMFAQLAMMLQSYTPRQKRILLGVLRAKDIKKNLPFGTKVYLHAFGKDYISNYLSGYVIGYTSSHEVMLSGSPEQNTRGKCFTAFFKDSDNLLLPHEWKLKKRQLKDEGKLYDPNPAFATKTKLTDNSEPPTIDSAPDAWHNKNNSSTRKTKRKIRKAKSDTFKVS